MIDHGIPERVYVENDWYDGPRAGIADIDGHPHRFKANFDDSDDEHIGTFSVWPVAEDEMSREIEQWQIFVEWNDRYELGQTTVEDHPGNGGINARWDEIETLLRPRRSLIPPDARRATVQVEHIPGPRRYGSSGPAYLLRWKLL